MLVICLFHCSIALNNNNIVTEVEEKVPGDGPPVFRHLNAEFRQQLKLKKRSQSIEKTQLQSPIPDQPGTNEPPVCDIKTNQEVVSNPVEEGRGHHFLRVCLFLGFHFVFFQMLQNDVLFCILKILIDSLMNVTFNTIVVTFVHYSIFLF